MRAPRAPRRRVAFAAAVAATLAATAAVSGQTPPPETPGSVPAAATAVADSGRVVGTVTPGGAFLRAVLIPGWGHAAIGADTRAGFYFAFEAATVYGLVRTMRRLEEVRARAAFRERILRQELSDSGVEDPAEIQTALEDDPTLSGYLELEEARVRQREDWLAFGIFLVFLSGADAYVSAHLKDFPAPLRIEGGPTEDGRLEIGVAVPVGR